MDSHPPEACAVAILLYTDGITETFSPDEELFGQERVIETVAGLAGGADGGSTPSMQHLVTSIRKAAEAFRGLGPRLDDITILALKMQS